MKVYNRIPEASHVGNRNETAESIKLSETLSSYIHFGMEGDEPKVMLDLRDKNESLGGNRLAWPEDPISTLADQCLIIPSGSFSAFRSALHSLDCEIYCWLHRTPGLMWKVLYRISLWASRNRGRAPVLPSGLLDC